MNYLVLLFFLIPLSTNAKTVTCKKGKHQCGVQFPIFNHQESLSRRVSFGANSNYQSFWTDDYFQINKLFGSTDCGEYFKSRSTSAMLGWRHLPETDLIELTGYVHRHDINNSGLNFEHAPLGLISRFETQDLFIQTMGEHYLFGANENQYLLMKRGCRNGKFKGRFINTWFGGQRKAPASINMTFSKISQTKPKFPIELNLVDRQTNCSLNDPIDFLATHESRVWDYFIGHCQKRMLILYEGCNRLATSSSNSAVTWNSENSKLGLKFRIDCSE